MIRNSTSVSDSVSAAVGSSKMITRQFAEIALTISTTCCWDTESADTFWRGLIGEWVSKSVRSFRVPSWMSRKLIELPAAAVQGGHEDVLRHAHVLAEGDLLVHEPDAHAQRVVGAPDEHLRGRPGWISPASAWWTPPMTFIRVDLPAPFSPTTAWTAPGRRKGRCRRGPASPRNAC